MQYSLCSFDILQIDFPSPFTPILSREGRGKQNSALATYH